jgi:hypothetical protein
MENNGKSYSEIKAFKLTRNNELFETSEDAETREADLALQELSRHLNFEDREVIIGSREAIIRILAKLPLSGLRVEEIETCVVKPDGKQE